MNSCQPRVQYLVLTLFAALVAWSFARAWSVLRSSNAHDRRVLLFSWALLIAGCTAWIALVPPTYLHSNMLGPRLVDTVGCFTSTRREDFGPVGFALQGAIARHLGLGLPQLALVDAVFGALTLMVLSLAVRSLTKSALAALGTIACGVAWPALVRVIRSEDVHTLGAFLAAVQLAGLLAWVCDGRRSGVWFALLAVSLLVLTRQTYLPWVCMSVIVALAHRPKWRRNRAEFVAMALMVIMSLVRVAESARHPADAISVRIIFDLMRDREAWTSIPRYHPYFDIGAGALPVLALSLFGVFVLVRSGAPRALFGLALFGYLAITLPSGVPTPGDNLAFRLPQLHLAVACAGVGFASLLSPVKRSLPAGLAAVLLVLVGSVAVPGRARMLATSPLVDEERFLTGFARDLPRDGTMLIFHGKLRYAPAYAGPPRSTWQGPTLETGSDGPNSKEVWSNGRHVYFFQGLSCFMYSVAEIYSFRHPELRKERTLVPEPALLASLTDIALHAYRGRLPPEVVVPKGLRPECARIEKHGKLVGRTLRMARPDDELPFSVYTGDVELAVFEIEPSLMDEPPLPAVSP